MVKREQVIILAILFLISLSLNGYFISVLYSNEPVVKELLPNTLDRCYVVYFPGSQQRADVACVATGREGD